MKKHIRRIQLTGGSTFIVSLPKPWVLRQRLSPGSQVIIEERGPGLVVKPLDNLADKRDATAVIHIGTESPDLVVKKIVASYLMGFDTMIVKSDGQISPLIRNMVRSLIVSKLLGTEVMSEDDKEIQLRVLLNAGDIPLQDVLKRLSRVVNSVVMDACESIIKGEMSMVEEIIKEDDSVDRMYFYTIRMLNKVAEGSVEINGDFDLRTLLAYRALSKLLERIGDHAVSIARHIRELQGWSGTWSDLKELCMEVHKIYADSVDAFFNMNMGVISTIDSLVKELRMKEEKLLKSYLDTSNSTSLVTLRLILESIRRIAEYSRDIAELSLDLSIVRMVENH